MNKIHTYLVLIILLLFSASIFAQEETIIVGQVLDKSDKQPLVNASVFFEGSNIGTVTNKEGYFVLRSLESQKLLIVSMIGYKTKKIKLELGKSKGLEIELSEENRLLKEIIIVPSNSPANKLMQKVRAARKLNNPDLFLGYKTTIKEEIAASISHITRKSLNSKLFKDIQNGLLTAEDSSLLLPVYYSEETFSLKKGQKESLQNTEKSIILTESNAVKEFVNKLPVQVNFYENYISILGKNFLSPLANIGSFSYNYYIKDSIKTLRGKEYTVAFKPKNKKDLAFEGTMRIDSATFSLTNISATLSSAANINFIQRLAFIQDFYPIDKSKWAYKNQETTVNFQLQNKVGEKVPSSFFVSKHSHYAPFEKDSTLADSQTIYEEIPPTENLFSSTVDTLSHTKLMRSVSTISDILINKYVHIGYFDWGPITLLSSYNRIEGERFTLGGRTGKKLFKDFTLGGYGGWGTTDKEWKYGGEIQYRFKKKNYTLIGIKYINDMYQTDYNYHDEIRFENSVGNGLADLSTVIIHGFGGNYNRRENLNIFFDKEWYEGVNTHLALAQTRYLPNLFVPFEKNGFSIPSIQDYSFTLDFRFSYKERIMDEFFHRIYLSNYYPVTHFVVEGGNYETSNSNAYYLKLHTSTTQSFLLGNFGKFNYSLEGGYIFGEVPFPLLEIYSGYEASGIEKYNIKDISFRQFASDAYVNIQTLLSTNGIILNHIPLINKLNLREIFGAKIACGRLQDKQITQMDLPPFITALESPYFQLSAGISNIFRVLAIEYIWEVPQTGSPEITNRGVQLKLYVDF